MKLAIHFISGFILGIVLMVAGLKLGQWEYWFCMFTLNVWINIYGDLEKKRAIRELHENFQKEFNK